MSIATRGLGRPGGSLVTAGYGLTQIILYPPEDVLLEEISPLRVRISWPEVVGAQNGYDIERDGVVIAQGVMDTIYIDEDVPTGERIYRVGTVV